MASIDEQDRRDTVKDILASWAIEGFEPDANYLVAVERYIRGELTVEDLLRYHDDGTQSISSAA